MSFATVYAHVDIACALASVYATPCCADGFVIETSRAANRSEHADGEPSRTMAMSITRHLSPRQPFPSFFSRRYLPFPSFATLSTRPILSSPSACRRLDAPKKLFPCSSLCHPLCCVLLAMHKKNASPTACPALMCRRAGTPFDRLDESFPIAPWHMPHSTAVCTRMRMSVHISAHRCVRRAGTAPWHPHRVRHASRDAQR